MDVIHMMFVFYMIIYQLTPVLSAINIRSTDSIQRKIIRVKRCGFSGLVQGSTCEAPTVRIGQPSYSAEAGNPITLECSVTSNPEVTRVYWTKKTLTSSINITSSTIISKYSGSSPATPSLTILNTELVDAGEYQCSATNSAGTNSSSQTRLIVISNYPVVYVDQLSYLVNVDDNVTLVCEINSTLPVLTVLWQRSTDSEIKNITYDTNMIKYGGSKPSVPSLTIKGVHQGDAGKYTCLAANEKGTGKSGTISLNVTGVPCGGIWTEKYGTLIFPANIQNTQTCQYRINLPTDFTLLFSFIEERGWSPPGYTIKIYDGKDYTSNLLQTFLTISEPIIIQSKGNSLFIEYSRYSSGSEDIKASYYGEVSILAPTVTVNTTYLGHVGKQINLGCQIQSRHTRLMEVQWKFTNQARVTTDPIIISKMLPLKYQGSSVYSPSLSINNLTKCDQGTYWCRGTNEAGTTTSIPMTLTVIKVAPPEILQIHDNVSVLYGESAEIFCNVSSDLNITSVTWEKRGDSENINTADKRKYSGGTLNNTSLTILRTDQYDDGEYRCTVSNSQGIGIGHFIPLHVTDTNECEDRDLNTCSQECENTYGSFHCRCWDGYIGQHGRYCRVDYDNIGNKLKTILMSVTVIDRAYKWNNSLNDSSSEYYKQLEALLLSTITSLVQGYSGYRETKIISISPGSIIVNFGIILAKDSNRDTFVVRIQQAVTAQAFGNITVKNETITIREGLGYISNMVMNTTVAVHEGSTQAVECLVDAISITGNVDFKWKLSGSVVKPTPASRLQILYNKMSNTRYNSTLLIKNINQRDSGNLTCKVLLGNSTEERFTEISLYRFTIQSLSKAVQIRRNTNVTCTIFPTSVSAKQMLVMCQDGNILSDSQLRYTNNSVTLTLTSLTSDTAIGCGWSHKESCSKTIKIHVFSPKIQPCSAESSKQNITWSETFPGITDYQTCPLGFKGSVSRKCWLDKDKYSGVWEEPNFLNCTRAVFVSLLDELDRIEDGVQVETLVNVLKEFSNESDAISYGNDSTASDINSGVEILTKVSEIVTDREENITNEETEEFFVATDHMLSSNSKKSWEELGNKTKEDSAAKMMNIVSKVSDKILKSLSVNESVNIVRENIVLEIKNAEIDEIKFPTIENLNKSLPFKSQVILAKKTIENSLNVNGSVQYSAVYYKTMSELLITRKSNRASVKVGSPIMAFSIPRESIKTRLNPPIELVFQTIASNLTHRECSYWNFNLPNGGGWAKEGCQTKLINKSMTVCMCDHLTNFAVIMSLQDITGLDHDVLSTLSIVGCIISIICLVITLAVYAVEWKNLTSAKSVILVIICIVLILAYITFMAGINKTQNKIVCTAVALLLHLLFLIVLFLMAAEGVIHAVLVVAVFPQRRSINQILLPLAFGMPILIVIVAGSVTRLEGYGTSKFCWLSKESGLIYAFFGPCIAVIVMNLFITGLILKKLFSTRATMNKSKKEKLVSGVRSIAILAPIFGLTWFFGLLSFHEDTIVFSYLFVICNSFQGLFIFVMHGIFNQNVRKSVKRRVSRLSKERDFTTGTKSTESTNTWNVFKKIKSKTGAQSHYVSESVISGGVVTNPLYSRVDEKSQGPLTLKNKSFAGPEEQTVDSKELIDKQENSSV